MLQKEEATDAKAEETSAEEPEAEEEAEEPAEEEEEEEEEDEEEIVDPKEKLEEGMLMFIWFCRPFWNEFLFLPDARTPRAPRPRPRWTTAARPEPIAHRIERVMIEVFF